MTVEIRSGGGREKDLMTVPEDRTGRKRRAVRIQGKIYRRSYYNILILNVMGLRWE